MKNLFNNILVNIFVMLYIFEMLKFLASYKFTTKKRGQNFVEIAEENYTLA